MKVKPKIIHGTDKIITEFNDLYQNNTDFWNGLMCCLLHSFVVKLSCNTNSQYAAGELNFSLALAAGGNRKAYESVAVNIGLMSLCHSRRVFASIRIPPFIHLILNETNNKVCIHFHNIRKAMGNTSTPISSTV